MGLCCRIRHECLHAAEALRKTDHSYFFQNGKGKLFALELNRQHRAEASCLFFHDLVARVIRQSRIDHSCDCFLLLQPCSNLFCILLGAFHADA